MKQNTLMWTLLYLKVLQHSKLLLLTVHFKSYSKKSLNTVEPEAVISNRHLQPMEPEHCNNNITLLSICVRVKTGVLCVYIYYCLVCFYFVFYLRKSLFLLPVLSWQTWHGVWDGSLSGCQCWRKDQLLNKEELLDSETQIICSILSHILKMPSITIWTYNWKWQILYYKENSC